MTDHQILAAMEHFGGSFARALGRACQLADAENLRKIRTAFPELWEEYDDLARLWAEKQSKETT